MVVVVEGLGGNVDGDGISVVVVVEGLGGSVDTASIGAPVSSTAMVVEGLGGYVDEASGLGFVGAVSLL